jgi:hypothetical protein
MQRDEDLFLYTEICSSFKVMHLKKEDCMFVALLAARFFIPLLIQGINAKRI